MVEDSTKPTARKFTIPVPAAAIPGQTVLGIKVGESSLDVLVPAGAKVGDKMLITENLETQKWSVQLVLADTPKTVSVAPCSSKPAFENIVDAIHHCGGVVSSKLERRHANASGMCGIFAREAIEEGEELLRVPSKCFISERTMKAVEPELFAAFDALSDLEREGLLGEARLATFVAKLIADALTRMEADAQPDSDGGPMTVWTSHAEALLEENFSSHPYWNMVHNHSETCAHLLPSPEGAHAEARAKEVMQTCRLIMQKLPAALLGPKFGPGFYLQARLCTLTRSCDCVSETSIVPILDFFNHSYDHGLSWHVQNDECVVQAMRNHSVGDHLCISYGQKSNPLLYRTYGFTIQPESEPSWAFVLQGPKPKEIYEEYLPSDLAEHAIHFDTLKVKDSLLKALRAVKSRSLSASDFLYTLCSHCRNAYEQDSALEVPIASLNRLRVEHPDSGAWWSENSLESKCEDAIRIKMSEYLALTAHIEIAEVSAGRRSESQCLRLPSNSLVRQVLVRACTS